MSDTEIQVCMVVWMLILLISPTTTFINMLVGTCGGLESGFSRFSPKVLLLGKEEAIVARKGY